MQVEATETKSAPTNGQTEAPVAATGGVDEALALASKFVGVRETDDGDGADVELTADAADAPTDGKGTAKPEKKDRLSDRVQELVRKEQRIREERQEFTAQQAKLKENWAIVEQAQQIVKLAQRDPLKAYQMLGGDVASLAEQYAASAYGEQAEEKPKAKMSPEVAELRDAIAEMQRMQREMLEERQQEQMSRRMTETVARVQTLSTEHADEFPLLAAWMGERGDSGGRFLVEEAARIHQATGARPSWKDVFTRAEAWLGNEATPAMAIIARSPALREQMRALLADGEGARQPAAAPVKKSIPSSRTAAESPRRADRELSDEEREAEARRLIAAFAGGMGT